MDTYDDLFFEGLTLQNQSKNNQGLLYHPPNSEWRILLWWKDFASGSKINKIIHFKVIQYTASKIQYDHRCYIWHLSFLNVVTALPN